MSAQAYTTRPTLWVGDLRDLPEDVQMPDSFWQRFAPGKAYIEGQDDAEEYLAVVVNGYPLVVRCMNDGQITWVINEALVPDQDAFAAGLAMQASDGFDWAPRGTM